MNNRAEEQKANGKGRRAEGRQNSRKKRILLYCSIAVLPLVSLILLEEAIINSLPVKKVVFIGNRHLSEDELRNLMGITQPNGITSKGISKGKGVNLKSIKTNLMKSPWIKDVCIRREIPDVLKIRVYEAEPLAILEMQGRPFLIDEHGRLLEELRGEAIPFLPVILSDPFKNKESFMEAINLALVLRKRNIAKERNRVEIIANRDRESLSAVIDGVVIKVGYGNYDEKFDRLFKLEDMIREKAMAVEYIDLRFSNKAIVKPVKEVVK